MLKKIKRIGLVLTISGGAVIGYHFISSLIRRWKISDLLAKSKNIDYSTAVKWINHKQSGVNLEEFFKEKGYKSIALYDMNEMSLCLCRELEGSGIEVRYGIVHCGTHVHTDLPIYSLDEEFPEADVIVVMNPYHFESIRKDIRGKGKFDIVSIEDVVYEI